MLSCAGLLAYYMTSKWKYYFMYEALTYVFPGVDVVQMCQDMLVSSRFLDGKDALQWATYNINQGPHKGKKILAYMGTDFSNVEQVAADIWSTPMANNMIKTMANEAKEVAIKEKPDFITGHSLGGLIAEMVCSMTGIPGASFAALGAFDPFSVYDEAILDLVDLDSIPENVIEATRNEYREILRSRGYDEEDIEEIVSDLDIEDLMTRLEYTGVIEDTMHNGVKFEVVMNVHDIPARTFGSIDGNQCSHIASSCDLRWTWFGGGSTDTPLDRLRFWEMSMGHSSAHYSFNVNSKWTRGHQKEDEANIDYSKIFLPGVTKNLPCDFCDDNGYCESGSCDVAKERCFGPGRKYPTYCPASSDSPNHQTDCYNDGECLSGRCDGHTNPFWASLGYGLCYEKETDGTRCNEDSDCQSGFCNWQFVCATKKPDGAYCVNWGDCWSNHCTSLWTCGKRNRGNRCIWSSDCKSNSCSWRGRCN